MAKRGEPLFFVILLLLPLQLLAADRLVLESGQDIYRLGSYLEIFEDSTKRLSVEQVTAEQFEAVDQLNLNLGLSESAYWLRFQLLNRSAEQEWLLDVGWLADPFAWIHVYGPDGQGGYREIVSEGVYQSVYPLPVTPEPAWYYLKMLPEGDATFLAAAVATRAAQTARSRNSMLAVGIFYGLMLCMAIYSLIFYLPFRQKTFLWYTCFIFSVMGYFVEVNGIIYDLKVFVNPEIYYRLPLFCIFMLLFSGGQFVRAFLMTSDHTPRLDRTLRATIWAALILALASFKGNIMLLNSLIALLGPAMIVLAISAGIICRRHGFWAARFFLVSWAVTLLGGISYALTYLGVLPLTFWTFYSFQIGIALGAILMAFALIDRVRHLQQNARFYRRMSMLDELTGLFNVRYFRRQLELQMNTALRSKRPLSLMMLDVDDFKAINDTYGHTEGDRVLADLCRIIQGMVRASDVPCRYGGEEFSLIMPETSIDEAAQVAGRIRLAIAGHHFSFSNGDQRSLTASIGIAEMQSDQRLKQLVSRADGAMYEAKKSGKNRVVVAGED